MAQDVERNKKDAERRIEEIKRKISGMDLVCSGTLMKRKKKCGKLNCRCATNPDALHGPYHEWNRWENGRLVHKIVSEEQSGELAGAIANQREIKALLKEWERETSSIILGNRKRRGG